MKTERGTLLDWTAVNGVRIFCGNPLDNVALTSSVGPWGDWKDIFYCGSSGYLVGFQLRVERPGLLSDETATNNIRFFCSNAPAGKFSCDIDSNLYLSSGIEKLTSMYYF